MRCSKLPGCLCVRCAAAAALARMKAREETYESRPLEWTRCERLIPGTEKTCNAVLRVSFTGEVETCPLCVDSDALTEVAAAGAIARDSERHQASYAEWKRTNRPEFRAEPFWRMPSTAARAITNGFGDWLIGATPALPLVATRAPRQHPTTSRLDPADVHAFMRRFSTRVPEAELEVYQRRYVRRQRPKRIMRDTGWTRSTVDNLLARLRQRVRRGEP